MSRRTAMGIATAAVVVVIVVTAVAWWASTRTPSAEDAAMAYLDALAAGDGAAVTAAADGSLEPDDQTILRDAFAGASEYPSEPRIEELSAESDGRSDVQAEVMLGGERQTIRFAMTLEDDRWRVTSDHLPSLTVTTTLGDSVWVGNALVPAGAAFVFLPAVYPVAAAPRTALAGDTTVVLAGDGPVTAAVAASVAPGAAALAQQQLEAYQDACTRPAPVVPGNCGLRVPWAADLASLASLSWRIEQRPALTLSPDGSAFAATGGVVVATATGTTSDGRTSRFTYRADDWALRGTIRFSGDTMTLAVN